MQKNVRYYIHTSGEQPAVRTVPVADQRPAERPRSAPERRPLAAVAKERTTASTPVRRLRQALKRSMG